MKIKTILLAVFIIFALWCITTNIRYFIRQNKIISERQNKSKERAIPLNELFKEQLSIYKNRADSISKEINLQYGYDTEVIGCVYPQNSILNQIPYYGMTNGKEAFIYSLHLRDLRQLRLFVKSSNIYFGIDKSGRVFKIEVFDEN